VSQIVDFLAEPHRYSMTRFYSSAGNPFDAYGMVATFTNYLVSRLGDSILTALHDPSPTAPLDTSIPTSLLDRVLAARGMTFDSLFSDFSVALAIDDAPGVNELPEALRARLRIPDINLYRGSDGKSSPYVGLDGPSTLRGPAPAGIGGVFVTGTLPHSVSFFQQNNLTAGARLAGTVTPPTGVTFRLLTR
jgi:hypothetical protein